MTAIIQKIKNSDKPYYTKGEIIQLLESALPKKPPKIECSGVTVDLDRYVISTEGRELKLPKKITELVYYLASNQGRVLHRNEILNQVWGSEVIVGDRTIDVHIRKIRRALPIDCITTVKGVGYQWN
jgi:two-component system alkaline phosphatase synthesis response regulator PhoP